MPPLPPAREFLTSAGFGGSRSQALERLSAHETAEGAGAEGIIHNANRVMDYYERFLRIAGRAKGVSAPAEFVTVLNDTGASGR